MIFLRCGKTVHTEGAADEVAAPAWLAPFPTATRLSCWLAPAADTSLENVGENRYMDMSYLCAVAAPHSA